MSVRKLCAIISFCSMLTADSRTDVLFGQDRPYGPGPWVSIRSSLRSGLLDQRSLDHIRPGTDAPPGIRSC
jgi:hypothetical protein